MVTLTVYRLFRGRSRVKLPQLASNVSDGNHYDVYSLKDITVYLPLINYLCIAKVAVHSAATVYFTAGHFQSVVSAVTLSFLNKEAVM